jgi:hypothetical protein
MYQSQRLRRTWRRRRPCSTAPPPSVRCIDEAARRLPRHGSLQRRGVYMSDRTRSLWSCLFQLLHSHGSCLRLAWALGRIASIYMAEVREGTTGEGQRVSFLRGGHVGAPPRRVIEVPRSCRL